MKTVLILALDGVMDSSLAITRDTLRAGQAFAARSGRAGSLRVLTAGERSHIKTGGDLRLTVDLCFAELEKAAIQPDWIVIPGLGLVSDAAVRERFAQSDAKTAMRLLNLECFNAAQIGASCSAVFLLGEAGLLAGRRVTMTWWLAELFRQRHPGVALDETRMLVRDGRFLTAGAAFAQLDLSLAILADTLGTAIAHQASRYLLIDERPSQARYMMPTHSQQADPTVIAAERWIDAHLAQPIRVDELSRQLAVSPKTLARRIQAATGISPVKLIQRRRLLQAAHLLETTRLSIEAVAAKVGYQDSTALRKLVRREFGTTPAAIR